MILETKKRSVIKAISWRLIGTLVTTTIVFIITEKASISLALGGSAGVLKMILYYIHERAWQKIDYGRKKTNPAVIWFTGLSGSGKSTIADGLEKQLAARGIVTERLDGDSIRDLFPQTGFTKEERTAHLKRVGHLASILEKRGIVVIASFVSPYRESRDFIRSICRNFIEVYVTTPIEECERRDVKGLYGKVRRGELKNFTGIDAPYESPSQPEIIIDTTNIEIKKSVALAETRVRKIIGI